ncbi:MAG TPA: hypothetical protein VLZ10_10100 [Thermodesulfobacteriota bacterium]|nr:hypothetical protein [Thermodesulfobacteriota bacterium]
MKRIKIMGGGVALSVVAALFSCSYIHPHKSSKITAVPELIKIHREYGSAKDSSKIQYVSLINLIATPEKYHGKWVRVIGIANFEFEGDALYLSQSDYKFVTKNAVWLSLDTAVIKVDESTLAKEFNGLHVVVEGIYDMNDHGHMGLFSGAITNVTRILTWMKR